MATLKEKIIAEEQNISQTIEKLNRTFSKKKRSSAELAGVAMFLCNIYNGIENILKLILKSKVVPIPSSDRWHKELLELSVSKRIISKDLSDKLVDYLDFRHFALQSYALILDEVELKPLVDNIPNVYDNFTSEINAVLEIEE